MAGFFYLLFIYWEWEWHVYSINYHRPYLSFLYLAFNFFYYISLVFVAVITKNTISKLTRIWLGRWDWIQNCYKHHMLPLVWMDIWLVLAVSSNIWMKSAHWAWQPLKKTTCGTMLKRMKVAHSTVSFANTQFSWVVALAMQ